MRKRFLQCKKGVFNGQVLWTVQANSDGPVSDVENFLNSFQPIG
jgi:hypothetical protein